MGAMLGVVGFVAFVVLGLPLLFKLKRKYIEKALPDYAAANGVKLELEKAGMPPFRHWFKNRKGDCWGRVRFPDGRQQWIRLRGRMGSGSPLTFFD